MKRNQFIKSVGLTSFGVTTGILKPTSLFANELPTEMKLELCEKGVIDLTVAKDDELIWGWLLRAVGSALISSLVGKIVDNYSGNSCYCNGSSCTKNNASSSDYSNTVGYYGYNTHNQKFLTQQIYDRNTSFENASVPFIDKTYNHISNVEGPFLGGLCAAAKDINSKYGLMMARNVIVPFYQLSNGGYRFDTTPCYPTVLKTNYGKTAISYTPNGDTGYVKVDAYNSVDRLDYSQTWKVNAV
jgi:hypothetical protein